MTIEEVTKIVDFLRSEQVALTNDFSEISEKLKNIERRVESAQKLLEVAGHMDLDDWSFINADFGTIGGFAYDLKTEVDNFTDPDPEWGSHFSSLGKPP